MILGAQEINGNLVINPDGTRDVSEPARKEFTDTYMEVCEKGGASLPYPCAPKIEPVKLPSDLNNKEKYSSWHKKWIDGTYKSMLETLNVQPNFLIPFFDPMGVALKMDMKIPMIGSIQELIGVLAAPPVFLPGLLGVKPADVPDFLKNLQKLILPNPPSLNLRIPEIPKIPSEIIDLANSPNSKIILPKTAFMSVGLNNPSFPFNVPSTHAFNVQLIGNIPLAFLDLIKQLMDYNWMEFNQNSISELACKCMQKITPKPPMPPTPSTYKSAPPTEPYVPSYSATTATLAIMASKALLDSGLYSTIGAGSLIVIKAPASKKPVINNNLGTRKWTPKQGGQGEYEKLTQRDQRIVRSIPVESEEDDGKASENGLKRLHPRKGLVIVQPLRKLSYGDPLLLKLIESIADYLVSETRYRRSITESHHILEVGNICSWEREVFYPGRKSSYSRGHEGCQFDFAYPYRDLNGNKITGVLPDSKLFHKGVVNETLTPFLGSPDGDLPEGVEIDYRTLCEIAYFIFHIFQPKLIKDGMIEIWDHSKYTKSGKQKKKFPLIETICIGPKIYKGLVEWADKNLPEKFAGMNSSHSKLYGDWVAGAKFYPQEGHEDHAHVQGYRSILKSQWEKRTNVKPLSSSFEEKYLISGFRSGQGWKNYVEWEVKINDDSKTLRL